MNAIIKVTGEITSEVGERICDEFIDAEKSQDILQIVFFISSGGGNTSVIPPLRELVQMSRKSVVSIGSDYVGSTASGIFMMPPRRILMPATDVLIHESRKILQGAYTAYELEEMANETKSRNKVIFGPLLQNSTLPAAVLKKKVKDGRDWHLTEEEILRYRIVTEPYNREEVRKLLVDYSK